MLASHDLFDLRHGRGLRVTIRDLDVERPDPVRSHDTELCRLDRNEDPLVLVEPAGAALRFQHSHDFEGHVPDRDPLAEHFQRGARERLRHGAPENGHSASSGILLRCKETSVFRCVVVELIEIRGRSCHPHVGVRACELDLRVRYHLGGRHRDGLRTALHRVHVGDVHAGARRPDAAVPPLARAHCENVGPQRLQLALDGLLCPGTEGNHRDDGAHADHDAQHGEQAAHLVGADRLKCYPDDLEKEHGRPLSVPCRA